MYPYREGAAGDLRSHYETGEASEALLAEEEIVSLAKQLLSKEAYAYAEELSQMLVKTRAKRNAARSRLMTSNYCPLLLKLSDVFPAVTQL